MDASGRYQRVLAKRFDALESDASVYGFTDRLSSLWTRTLVDVVNRGVHIPIEVMEVLSNFSPQGLPYCPRHEDYEKYSKNKNTDQIDEWIRFVNDFQAYCAKPMVVEQEKSTNIQAEANSFLEKENRINTYLSKGTRNNAGILQQISSNKREDTTKTKESCSDKDHHVSAERGVSNCYRCLQKHDSKIIFVFEEGMESRQVYVCHRCWCKESKSRFDEDSMSDSSASEYGECF